MNPGLEPMLLDLEKLLLLPDDVKAGEWSETTES